MAEEMTTWLAAKRSELLWDLLFSSLIEVLIIFAALLLITPFFETLSYSWYVFFCLFLPLYVFSEAAAKLGKLQQLVIAEPNLVVSSAAERDKPVIVQPWQCVSVASVLTAIVPGLFCSMLYYVGDKSIATLVLLALIAASGVFVAAAMIFSRYSQGICVGTVQQLQRHAVSSETQSVEHVLRYHLLPWGAFATLVFGFLMSQYYLGLVAEAGEVSLSALATYSYMSFSLVGFWSYYTVLPGLKNDVKLQALTLHNLERFGFSEVLGMILGFACVPWLILFALGFFVPALSSSWLLFLLAMAIVLLGAVTAIVAATLQQVFQQQQASSVSAEKCV